MSGQRKTPVYLLAADFQHIVNWARRYDFDLPKHDHIRWAETPMKILGSQRGGYFVVLSWPKEGDKLTRILKNKQYLYLDEDINQWPVELFT